MARASPPRPSPSAWQTAARATARASPTSAATSCARRRWSSSRAPSASSSSRPTPRPARTPRSCGVAGWACPRDDRLSTRCSHATPRAAHARLPLPVPLLLRVRLPELGDALSPERLHVALLRLQGVPARSLGARSLSLLVARGGRRLRLLRQSLRGCPLSAEPAAARREAGGGLLRSLVPPDLHDPGGQHLRPRALRVAGALLRPADGGGVRGPRDLDLLGRGRVPALPQRHPCPRLGAVGAGRAARAP